MIRKLGLSAGLVGLLATLPLMAQAATLDLASLGFTRDASAITRTGATVVVAEDPGLPGVLQLFANDPMSEFLVTSFAVDDLTQVDFVLFGADPVDEVSQIGANAFGSDAATGLVQFLFTQVFADGVFAAFNGKTVLVEVQANGLLPFADGFATSDGGTLTLTRLQSVNVVPLPAGMPLLLAGFGALALLRRRRAAV